MKISLMKKFKTKLFVNEIIKNDKPIEEFKLKNEGKQLSAV